MTKPKIQDFKEWDKIDPTGRIAYDKYRKAKNHYITEKKRNDTSKSNSR
jgi:hypothetical protein